MLLCAKQIQKVNNLRLQSYRWIKYVFVSFIAFFSLHCVDDSLSSVPIIAIERSYRELPFKFGAGVEIEEGLLYRKLKENGYEDLVGLAQFSFPKLPIENAFEYNLLLLSCKQGLDQIQLLVTVHKKYKSVLDVFAINPAEQEILQIYPDAETLSILEIDLIPKSEFATDVQQIFKLKVSADGKIEQD